MCVYQRNHSKPNLLTAEGCLDHMKWIKLLLYKWPASSSTSSDDDSADTTTGTGFVVPSRAAASNAALCLRMWPPSACPVGNTTPQAWHRCTSLVAAPLPGLAPSKRSRPSVDGLSTCKRAIECCNVEAVVVFIVVIVYAMANGCVCLSWLTTARGRGRPAQPMDCGHVGVR